MVNAEQRKKIVRRTGYLVGIVGFVSLQLFCGCASMPHNGKWEKRSADGTLLESGELKNGKRVGRWTTWNYQGKKTAEGDYEAGEPTGEWRLWTDTIREESKRPRGRIFTPKLSSGLEFSVLGADAYPARAGYHGYFTFFNFLRLGVALGFGGNRGIQSSAAGIKVLPFGFVWEYLPYGTPVLGVGYSMYEMGERQFGLIGKGSVVVFDVGYWFSTPLRANHSPTLGIGVIGALNKSANPAFYVKIGFDSEDE